MRAMACVVGLSGFLAAGCVTASPGESLAKVNFGFFNSLGAQVAFDHGCPQERIILIRSEGTSTADVDVCGVVRRYKSVTGVAGSGTSFTWLDVTTAYPPSALPAPLAPVTGK